MAMFNYAGFLFIVVEGDGMMMIIGYIDVFLWGGGMYIHGDV